MKNHTKIYFDYFGYDKNSFIECEVCGAKAVDINTININEGSHIENIIAFCLKCSKNYSNKSYWSEWLIKIHKIKLIRQ